MIKDVYATIRDVAREAGVSTMTVTRAFQRNALIAEKTRKRIIEVANELNFIPNYNARGLRGAPTMSIGILMSNPFGNSLVRPLSLALMQANYVSFIADSLGDTEIVRSGLQDFCGRKVTGVILEWREHYKEDARLMHLLSHLNNVVLYSKGPCDNNIPYSMCTLQLKPAYRVITEELLKSGCRDIVFVGRQDQWETQACLAVFAELGIKESECLVETSTYQSKPAFANYYDELYDRLTAGKIPDAVFAGNDVAAAQICSCLQAFGLQVPGDVAVIGCNNETMSPFCSPPIASIDQDRDLVADLIYKMLMRRINHPESEIEHKKVSCHYIPRESANINKKSI